MTPDVTILQGDCRELMREIPAGSVDAIVTDPPYETTESGVTVDHIGGVGKRYEVSDVVGDPWGYSLDWVDIAASLRPKHWVVFCNYLMLGDLHVALARHASIGAVFIWRKTNAPQMVRPVPRLDCEFIIWAKAKGATNGRMKEFKSLVLDVPMPQGGCFAVERVLIPGTGKSAHPCQKPHAIVQPFVSRILDPVATILDPFAGTGTTGVACLKAGHRAILIEDDPQYIPIIERRVKAAETPLFPMEHQPC